MQGCPQARELRQSPHVPGIIPVPQLLVLSLASPVLGSSDVGDSELLACRHPDPAATSPTTSTDTLSQGEQ